MESFTKDWERSMLSSILVIAFWAIDY